MKVAAEDVQMPSTSFQKKKKNEKKIGKKRREETEAKQPKISSIFIAFSDIKGSQENLIFPLNRRESHPSLDDGNDGNNGNSVWAPTKVASCSKLNST